MKVKIDGVIYDANPGETALKLCRRVGLDIPTLCYDERLEPFTACWVCLIEVSGRRGLSPACGIYVEDGMEIRTRGEDIYLARKTALELLLSTHFGDCYPPCTLRCPSNVDIQGYIGLVGSGKYIEAVNLIRETNPFPSICGRVCTRPCEDACRRNIVDLPVGIDYIKRFAADIELSSPRYFIPPKACESGKKVALVGAGPASLTCAYYLALNGHKATVFEAEDEPGGMMRFGIPAYRLPREVIKKEIEIIEAVGVEIQTQKRLGVDFLLEELVENGYDAIFLGVGAWRSTPLGIDGETANGVLAGIEFLREVAKGRLNRLDGKVVVIGGGNTAIDAARTSLRLGAREVSILYRRTEREMPARKEEVDEAVYEGVRIQFLVAPKRVISDSYDRVVGLECIRMELGEPDSSGRRKPIPVPGSEFIVDCNYIIAAIGQKPDRTILEPILKVKDTSIKWTKWDTIEVNPETLQTSIPFVFAGGDAVNGPATVIESIAQGRRAAFYIDRYLKGLPLTGFGWLVNTSKRSESLDDFPKEFYRNIEKSERNIPILTKLSERRGNFDETELPYSETQARNESMRCLSCGCIAVNDCELKRVADQYGANAYAFTKERELKQIDSRHPFIEFDLNKCILCARCVRICDELMGITALGLVNRGFATLVAPALGKPLQNTDCINCGQCIYTCPTGAIIEKPEMKKYAPFKFEITKTTCGYCDVGCTLLIESVNGSPIKTRPDMSCPVSNGNLCVKGKFGLHPLVDSRAKTPITRQKGMAREISFDEAFKLLPALLGKAYGTIVFLSPALTNEELYAAYELAKNGLKAKGIYSFSLLPFISFKELLSPSATLNDISPENLIIIYDIDFTRIAPVVGIKIREALKKGGTLIAVDSPTKMLRGLQNIEISTPDEKSILNLIKKYRGKFNKVVIIMRAYSSPKKLDKWVMMRTLTPEINFDYLFVGSSANFQGLLDIVSSNTNMLTSYDALEMLKNGELSALVVGEDPVGANYPEPYKRALEGAASLVVLDNYLTETGKLSDLFIPSSLWLETAGTFTTLERRLRYLQKTKDSPSALTTLDILAEIGKLYNVSISSSPAKIFEEITKNLHQYTNLKENEIAPQKPNHSVQVSSLDKPDPTLIPETGSNETSAFQFKLIEYLRQKGLKNLPI